MYYVLIENTSCIEILEFETSKQADIAKLVLQTYFYNMHRRIYILDEPHYSAKQFGKKYKYNLSRSWYNSLRRDVKRSIVVSPVIR